MNRTHIVLLIAFLGLSGFYMWAKIQKVEESEREYQKARFFTKVEEKDISAIRVVCSEPEFEYTLTRKGDHWYIGEHLLSVSQTHQLVSSVLELSREREMFAEPSEKEESDFRLDKPQYKITAIDNDGKELGTVKLGKRTPDYNHFYGQWAKGGEISTVPAYTLNVLEKEPKELTEDALLPVEVAAVDLITIDNADGEIASLERKGENEFAFKRPDLGKADETKVESFVTKLKDLKVGRFLGPKEDPEMGGVEVKYKAKVGYSEFEVVTELMQRVSANRKLVYGRRYLQKEGSTEPEQGTVERFVIEVLATSNVMNPSASQFEDKRAAVIDPDDMNSLVIEKAGQSVEAKRDAFGKWTLKNSDETLPEDLANGLLWTVKDLRYETVIDGEIAKPGADDLHIVLDQKKGEDADLRFGLRKNGKPYLWRQSKGYSLSDSSWKSLEESVTKILKSTQK